MTWQILTFPEVDKIKQAREQLHQAVQNVGSVGRSLLPHADDDHQANLRWDRSVQRLVGRWIEMDDGKKFRSSLSFSDFAVYLVDQDYTTISSIELEGKKQSTIMVWLEEQFDLLGQDSAKLNLQLPYEIPAYPTSKGQPFNLEDPESAEVLGKYFHNTDVVVNEVIDSIEGASDVRSWPHHFDIASLITLNDSGDPETSKSIGVGMSPGDENYDEPYFYVTPWPYPDDQKLTELTGTKGFWHTDGWIGAILTATNLSQSNIQEQHEQVIRFYRRSIENLSEIL